MDGNFKNDCVELLKLKLDKGEIDRRSFLRGLALLGVGVAAMDPRHALAQEKALVLVCWGGDATVAYAQALGAPFTADTGVAVKIDGSGPSEGAVQAQAQGGNITWDVMYLEYFSSITLGQKGFLGDIDYNIVKKDLIRPGGTHQWGVNAAYVSYVMVYDKAKFGDNPPKTWADFFDVEKFPGKRTFPKYMIGVPEAALLADGVAPDKLYPLDLDRAFKKIKDFMPNVVSVWSSGAESQQLMMQREAAIGILWNTRAIQVDRDTDGDVTFSYNDQLIAPDAWGYMKGNPAGAEAANKFIAGCQDPARQIELLRLIGNGPANPHAAALVPDDLKRIDCTQPEHLAVSHAVDMTWYQQNYGPALEKFLAMITT